MVIIAVIFEGKFVIQVIQLVVFGGGQVNVQGFFVDRFWLGGEGRVVIVVEFIDGVGIVDVVGSVVVVIVILVYVVVFQLQVIKSFFYFIDVVIEQVFFIGRVVVGFVVRMREVAAVFRDVIDR